MKTENVCFGMAAILTSVEFKGTGSRWDINTIFNPQPLGYRPLYRYKDGTFRDIETNQKYSVSHGAVGNTYITIGKQYPLISFEAYVNMLNQLQEQEQIPVRKNSSKRKVLRIYQRNIKAEQENK